jgi:CheY-like chemotaxis protein
MAQSAEASASPRTARALVLAVDDEPDALRILRWFLTNEGFEVMTAPSGGEALRRVEEYLPDLIIADYMMSDMSGLALCQRLRQHRATQHIPIILHTAAQITSLPQNSRLYDRVFTKPGDVLDLVYEVRQLLAKPH